MAAYSIGKANKQLTFLSKNQNPGVGAYETNSWKKISRIKTSPSSSIPKTKKFFNIMENIANKVGPGAYDPEKPQKKLFATIKGKLSIQQNSQVPSPAQYNISAEGKYSNTKYSFSRSHRKLKTEEGPGPAQYTLKAQFISVGGKFDSQQKDKVKYQTIPGPGTYNSKPVDTSSKSFQQFSFPKQKKFLNQELEQKMHGKIPGPGAYCINSFKKLYKGGKFGFGSRISGLNKSSAPGPGAYNPNYSSEKKNTPQPIIGQQKRENNYQTITPGPGRYQLPKQQILMKKDGNVVFTQEQRLSTSINKNPGPGQYNIKQLNRSRACSISARFQSQRLLKSPGPQSYQPQFEKVKKKAGGIVFGSERRLRNYSTQTPGPGTYQSVPKNPNKTYYFNKAKQIEKNRSTIGPGQYKLTPFIGMYDGIQKKDKEILYV